MTQATIHDGGEQKPTDEFMQSTGPAEHGGDWDSALDARTQGKMGGNALMAAEMESPQEQLPAVDEALQRLVDAYNGDVTMADDVMVDQALFILERLEVDQAALGRYKEILATTFQDMLRPGTQFASFDNETTMRVSRSPGVGKVSLKIDVTKAIPELYIKFSDREDTPVLNVATGEQMLSGYILRQARARTIAREQHRDASRGSTAIAGAVIGYARLSRNLLQEESLNFGPEARRYAEEAQQLLRDYAIEVAEEEMWASGTQNDGANSTTLIALMKELRHLNNDTVTEMLEVLDRASLALGPRLQSGMAALVKDFEGMRKLLGADPDSSQP